MKRVQISSSSLASVGYNIQAQILEIEFVNEAIYQYFNVPESIYSDLMSASLHGNYFVDSIRPGGLFTYKKIRRTRTS